jgi:penicillin-insensitive murein endopeptidase
MVQLGYDFAVCTIIGLLATTCAAGAADGDQPSNAWSVVRDPTSGPSEAIGGAADGCISGAAQLPLAGPGYEVIRPSRRRYFGHPDTIDFVVELGRRAKAADLPPFYVGDMAQPRGGPLPFGHRSHQNGLDVDIWFTFDTGLGHASWENLDLPSMLLRGDWHIDPARFGPRQVTLLKLAAADPRVDRIFVSPAIKLALCQGSIGNSLPETAWLRRLRPWWGHDDHFHVRLRCPATSPSCDRQTEVPEGDGCDAALEQWAHHLTPPTARPTAPRSPGPACQQLLAE